MAEAELEPHASAEARLSVVTRARLVAQVTRWDVVMFLYLAGLVAVYVRGPQLAAWLQERLGPMPVRGGLWTWAWSVDHVGAREAVWLVALTLIGGLLTGGWSRRPLAVLLRISPRYQTLAIVAVSLGAGLAMWYFRVGRSLGDRINYLLMLRDQQWFFMSQPLSTTTLAAGWAFLSRLGWPTEAAVALINCLAGVVWVFLLLKLASELPDWSGKLLVACGLLAGGATLFFGYIETTALPLASALGYVYLARRTLAGGTLRPAALAFGITVAMHGQMLLLGPSFLILCLAAWRGRHRWEVALALALAVSPTALVASYALTHRELILGPWYGDALGGGDSRMFVPLFEAISGHEHYTLFSFNHLTELANLALRAAPFAVLLLISAARSAWRQRGTWSTWFMGSVVVGSLLFVLLWNPDLGLAHDWDLFTPPLMLALVASVCLWPAEARPRAGAVWVGAVSGFSAVALAVTLNVFSPIRAWDPWATAWVHLEHPLNAQFGGAIDLLGFSLSQSNVAPGQNLVVKLYWRARRPLSIDYTAGVYLVKPQGHSGNIVSQDDHRPEAPIPWPDPRFSRGWIVGEVVEDNHHLAIPVAVAPGQYQIWAVLYDLNTLQRLSVAGGSDTDFVRLADIEITQGE